MNRIMRCCAAVALLGLAGASAATAQKPQTREGFWIGFGFGYGSSNVSCDGCTSASREGSGSGFLKLGGTLSPHVLLGGEINAWTKSVNATATLGNTSFAAYFYPTLSSGLFVKGGVGYATTRLSGGGSTATASGFGFVAGAGFDIRVGAMISITPVANFYFGSDGDMKSGGSTLVTGWKHNVYDFGLGITFH